MTDSLGLIYVDANVFITAFESEPAIAVPARDLFKAAQGRSYELVTSELTITEVLAPASAPGSLSASKKLEIYKTVLLWSAFIRVVPVTRTILLASASLRVDHRQKLPDAIHAATALEAKRRHFCSSDHDSRQLPPALTPVTPDAAGTALLVAALRT